MKTKNVNYYVYSALIVSLFLAVVSPETDAQGITPPDVYIGHPVGADYKIVNWETMYKYFMYVSDNSDRVNTREIGTTTEGRPYIVTEISSPDAIRNRDELDYPNFAARYSAEFQKYKVPAEDANKLAESAFIRSVALKQDSLTKKANRIKESLLGG